MPLIEGIGDEVVQFVAVVLVIVIAAVAWWSTNAQPDRYRAVLVMRSRTNHPVTVSIRTRSNLMITAEPAPSIQAALSDGPMPTAAEAANEDTSRVIPLQEMDSIVDADMAMLDNNRLHFYRRVDSNNTQTAPESTSDESEVHEEVEPASNAQIREMDSIVSAMEADVTTGCDLFTRAGEPNPATVIPTDTKKENDKETSAPSTANVEKSSETATTDNVMPTEGAGDVTAEEQESRRILIKLKYLNDTLKEVEGSLDELLKDFKWRHFSTELTAECRVRLIFNGRVLLDDAATLRACGLHDRAVVHCLVHPKRTVNQQRGSGEEGAGAAPELVSERAAPERAWDLENILMTLVSVALTVVWFFRCEYSNLFTASASLALFGLTVFYSVAIFGLYLSDTFQFDRRPPQPVPDN
ncbi:transmembrane and ubiquitin-like domain-containing protein 1 isoform X5 [Helicoverpa zea]|uniref:transmembrane and ubiquitin-like domain-containing protein 1 isoform X5 n=1 Tax=Helicoverpa zea TaxID=7113 RepID=UPI001F585E11|nr:transmembrane and ubiquitin-like domain-containing protein 1 isoform X5 [Helicoverpa zea]